jgi:hypothetical protein
MVFIGQNGRIVKPTVILFSSHSLCFIAGTLVVRIQTEGHFGALQGAAEERAEHREW